MQAPLLRLEPVGAPRPAAAARRLDRLADPRRPRRRQDPRRRGSGAPLGEALSDRQPDRPDRRRRARRDGARRIGPPQHLPPRRTAALSPLGRPARMAERRGEPALLGRGAGPAARQAAHEAVVRRARRLAATRGVRSGDVRPAPRGQAADGGDHDAAPDQDHQAPDGRTRTRSSPAARPSTTAAISPAPFSNGSPGATKAA